MRSEKQIAVIKYGGSLMHQPISQQIFARDVLWMQENGILPLIVHGGGKLLSHWMKKMGKEPVFIEGFRYSDLETTELSEMVLSGITSGKIVRILTENGILAVGLSGKDAAFLESEKMTSPLGKDLGFVGKVRHVKVEVMDALLQQGFVPVVSSIASDDAGNTLNLNADTVAQAIAVAVKARYLIFLTDVNKVLIDQQELSTVSQSELERLITHPDVTGGMLPKLHACQEALRGGVSQVEIVHGSLDHVVKMALGDTPIGTRFYTEGDHD